MKNVTLFSLVIIMLLTFSCKKEDLFEQPTVEVTGYTLKGLPGDSTYLDVDIKVINNDDREANLADVVYQIVIEGITIPEQEYDINKKILVGTPLELSFPLTLITNDAIKLLAILDKGEELDYAVTGTFHVNDPVLKRLDLPIDITGSAFVETGFEDYYDQPEITVNSISGSSSGNGTTNYIFDFDVECNVENIDMRSVLIDEVEYIVFIEGIESETHLYSESYSVDLSVAGESTFTLNLPVTLNLDSEKGAQLATAIEDGTIDYTVEGTFHVNKLEATATDFVLPLYNTGNISASIVNNLFEQPSVEVTGYTLLDLPGDSTYLEIDMTITNNDTREALITDIQYQVTIDDIVSGTENEDIDKNILVGTPLEITLPLTLLTSDAVKILSILDAGESLDYIVTGTFHVDEPVLNVFDLPIDISGTATVEVGFEDFFEQPEVTVTDMDGTYSYTSNGFGIPTSYTFNYDVNCNVENIDTRDAIIDEVEYVVYIEGVKSATHYYSDTYSTDLSISGSSTVALILPVSLTLGATEGATLATAVADGTVDYIIEGTFHVIEADGTSSDFTLPLYVTGSAPATIVQ